MSTHPNPYQQPTAALPAAAHPAYPQPYATYQPVPAIPPAQGRGTGFWVGICAIITVGVVLALLLGFFIGRGSRLSNADVQSKLTQQAQADQIAQQNALSSQQTAFTKQEAAAVSAARSAGQSAGQTSGYNAGYNAGYSAGQGSGFNAGQAAGVAQGQADGYSSGLNEGACLADSSFC